MDKKYIQENQVVERYLQGKLGPEEEAAYEAHYLADSGALAELELAERLKQGLEIVEREGGLDRSRSPADRIHGLLAALASPQYAAAASVLLLVSLVFSGVLYQENVRLTGPVLSDSSATRLELIFALRGAGGGREIPAGTEGEPVVLLLEFASPSFASYRATVTRESAAGSEEVAQIAGLEPGFQDYLAVSIPGRLMTEGEYQVLIEGRASDGQYEEVTRLPFRATAE